MRILEAVILVLLSLSILGLLRLNTFLKLSKYSVNTVEEHQGLKAIKGDRFLRPYTFSLLNYLMLRLDLPQ